MPLSDFVRYLNAQHPVSFSGSDTTPAFVSEHGRVFAYYSGLRLESAFQPIIGIAEEQLHGHGARLIVTRMKNNLPLQNDVLFTLPRDDAEFIYLDRLVRTLHALNYLTYLDWRSRGTLLLKVHPRHVASVASDHGLAFEEILRSCGLFTQQITLEFEIDGKADPKHLVQAFRNYRSRGYGIAVNPASQGATNAEILAEIAPEIVRIIPPLVQAGSDLHQVVDHLHGIGTLVMTDGLDDAVSRNDARLAGVDLLQVHTPLRQLKHSHPSLPQFSTATNALSNTLA